MSTPKSEIVEAAKVAAKWTARSEVAAKRRADLPPGTSRARVTSANAVWSAAAEMRDRCLDRVHEMLRVSQPGPEVDQARAILAAKGGAQ